MKVDILAFGAHPDDVELSCSGTIVKHISLGKKIAVIDLTQGELGTRGNAELRKKEAEAASLIMGIHARECLNMKDGFFQNDETHQLKVVQMIRKYQPEIVLCNATSDRHPDHARAGRLVADACFLSGLFKVETSNDGKNQDAWRPKAVYHYVQDRFMQPDFVIDISEHADKKQQSILAYASQFYKPDSTEPETPISSPEFLENVFAKMSVFGRPIGARYAEAFCTERTAGVSTLFDLI
ncbi:MAG: bacillithiol biosynthesis deacetylase BshB1 [Bacteroidota bacterium]|jgi:bacillithiol biosynthesis deacetylase BshB1